MRTLLSLVRQETNWKMNLFEISFVLTIDRGEYVPCSADFSCIHCKFHFLWIIDNMLLLHFINKLHLPVRLFSFLRS